MTIFISYSHKDAAKVNLLAANMVKRNAQVWVDTWELSVGDSIIQKIQDAITQSDALLVVLSKASVGSEWCKKELSSGLIRELEEKRVVVLPVLLEDCEIPLFLRDKMYADLRSDFDLGLSAIMNAIGKVSNPNQSRFTDEDGFTDWAVDWGDINGFFTLRFTIVNSVSALRMTILVEVDVICNEVLTSRQKQFTDAGLDWLGRMIISEALFDFGEGKDIKIVLDDSLPKSTGGTIRDESRGAEYHVEIRCRKLGEDNGKDQLVNVSGYLKNIRDYLRATSRKPNADETKKLMKIVATPM
jgi:hypothetical protein